jgi:hypothetical protein
MKQYILLAAAAFASGVLQLTKTQYEPRAACLEPLGEDRYKIKYPVTFKAGERLGWDQPVPKGRRETIVPVDEYEAGLSGHDKPDTVAMTREDFQSLERTIEELMAMNTDKAEEIEKLKAEIERLKADLQKANEAAKKSK